MFKSFVYIVMVLLHLFRFACDKKKCVAELLLLYFAGERLQLCKREGREGEERSDSEAVKAHENLQGLFTLNTKSFLRCFPIFFFYCNYFITISLLCDPVISWIVLLLTFKKKKKKVIFLLDDALMCFKAPVVCFTVTCCVNC